MEAQAVGSLRKINPQIVTQLAAASKAVDRASFAVVASGLQQCLTSDKPEMTPDQLEKMFLSLA